jgi:hypothetical protein
MSRIAKGSPYMLMPSKAKTQREPVLSFSCEDKKFPLNVPVVMH